MQEADAAQNDWQLAITATGNASQAVVQAQSALSTATSTRDTTASEVTSAQSTADTILSTLTAATTARTTAQNAFDQASSEYTSAQQDTQAGSQALSVRVQEADTAHNDWQLAITTTGNASQLVDQTAALAEQLDQIIIPSDLSVSSILLNTLSGDATIEITDDLDLMHSTVIDQQDLDPIDQINFDLDGDGALESFSFAFDFSATDNSNTLIAGTNDVAGDTLTGQAGDDLIFGGDGSDTIYAGDGDDIILGGDGDDIINGGLGDDTYIFTKGDDVIQTSGGSDKLEVGAEYSLQAAVIDDQGDLTFTVAQNLSSSYVISIDDFVSAPLSQIEIDVDGDGTVESFDIAPNFVATSANDTLIIGTDGQGVDTLIGGLGDDIIIANAGDDVLQGDEGVDTLIGGSGTGSISPMLVLALAYE